MIQKSQCDDDGIAWDANPRCRVQKKTKKLQKGDIVIHPRSASATATRA